MIITFDKIVLENTLNYCCLQYIGRIRNLVDASRKAYMKNPVFEIDTDLRSFLVADLKQYMPYKGSVNVSIHSGHHTMSRSLRVEMTIDAFEISCPSIRDFTFVSYKGCILNTIPQSEINVLNTPFSFSKMKEDFDQILLLEREIESIKQVYQPVTQGDVKGIIFWD